MGKVLRTIVAVGLVGVVVWVLYGWRDSRIEAVLETAEPGDAVEVGTDVCSELRRRGHVAPDTDYGYRDMVRVRLVGIPE